MEEFFDLFTDTYVRELAFQSCVNLTANAISKCEVKTYLERRRDEGGGILSVESLPKPESEQLRLLA